MSLLPPSLRQYLARARLLPGDAVARHGVGERRSNSKGEGIEFEDHRPYQVGDDMRRLDPHLHARFGEHYIRRFNVGQQLSVTLLLDASRSMDMGSGQKLAAAKRMVGGLAYVALASSDQVQIGVLSGGKVHLSPRWSGLSYQQDVETWLARWKAEGDSDLMHLVNGVRQRLRPAGLTTIVSDGWSETVLQAIAALSAAGQSVVMVQLLDAQEIDPGRTLGGPLRLVDAESGDEVEVSVGPEQLERYRDLLASWTEELRHKVMAVRGRFLQVNADQPPEEIFLRTLPKAGVLR